MSLFQTFRLRHSAQLILDITAEHGHVYRRDLINSWHDEVLQRQVARKHTNESIRVFRKLGVVDVKDHMLYAKDIETLQVIAEGNFQQEQWEG